MNRAHYTWSSSTKPQKIGDTKKIEKFHREHLELDNFVTFQMLSVKQFHFFFLQIDAAGTRVTELLGFGARGSSVVGPVHV